MRVKVSVLVMIFVLVALTASIRHRHRRLQRWQQLQQSEAAEEATHRLPRETAQNSKNGYMDREPIPNALPLSGAGNLNNKTKKEKVVDSWKVDTNGNHVSDGNTWQTWQPPNDYPGEEKVSL
jgi:hypothetical protein